MRVRDPAASGESRSASCSIWLVHTPVALITASASSLNVRPVSPQCAMTPRTAPSVTINSWTRVEVRMRAPCAAAVRAIATTRRASSVWPSQ